MGEEEAALRESDLSSREDSHNEGDMKADASAPVHLTNGIPPSYTGEKAPVDNGLAVPKEAAHATQRNGQHSSTFPNDVSASSSKAASQAQEKSEESLTDASDSAVALTPSRVASPSSSPVKTAEPAHPLSISTGTPIDELKLTSPISTVSEASTSPSKAAPKSWAALVKAKSPATPNGISKSPAKSSPSKADPKDILGGKFSPRYNGKLIRPRGLINNGNMCYFNAILQPLVYCPPFYNFFRQFGVENKHTFKSQTPLIDSILLFLNEFSEEEPGQKLDLAKDSADAFAPEYIYNALRKWKKLDAKGRQEDAEEFLGFLLDGLHEELLAVKKKRETTSPSPSAQDDQWLEVGKKNKTLVTRRMEAEPSPISGIFSGTVRSVLRRPGQRDSANTEPFQTLQLDISPPTVHSLQNALTNLTQPEVLEGYHPTSKAIKQNLLETLPPILILHLKRFVYDTETSSIRKLHKHVEYPITLNIRPDLLSPAARQTIGSNLTYRLFAVVYHHGKLAAGGHYTCDVWRASDEWMHFDDDVVTVAREEDVLREAEGRQPYMLFYCKN
ncbi:hypothetical protein HDV00_011295 [Rhizophlyctis rosea]|nr:hypothetical protein HDV00_011295 [Rhizophlyctis rosea]